MFLIVTRNFPQDLGGIQMLMGGLYETIVNHGPVKVFTYEYENSSFFYDCIFHQLKPTIKNFYV